MLLVLDDSLRQADPSDGNIRSALEQLLYAVGRGEHAMAVHPPTARHLLQIQLSPMPKAVLKHALENAPNLLAQYRVAKFRVRIVVEGKDPRKIGDSEWSLPLDWVRSNGVPTSCVLGENTRDAELFRMAAEQYLARVRTGCTIKLNVAGGGGADTPRTLATEIKNRRQFVLCITDSDKACPVAPESHTSRECAEIGRATGWIAWHFSLEEREIENLLPVNLVEDVVQSLGQSDLDDKLESLKCIAAQDALVWRYLDLKNGTPLRLMFGACSKFWEQFREHSICLNSSRRACIDDARCAAASRADCACFIAPPLGQRILEHVGTYLAKRSTQEAAKRSSTSANAARWGEVGALVSEWGVAAPKVRS